MVFGGLAERGSAAAKQHQRADSGPNDRRDVNVQEEYIIGLFTAKVIVWENHWRGSSMC
jgi:hypothetical protein